MSTVGPEPLGTPASPVPVRVLLPLPWAIWFWNQARKIVVFVIGMTLVGLGVAGLILPVLPGWLLIFGGFALLATEFVWARWMLKFAKERGARLMAAAKAQVSGNASATTPQAPAQTVARTEQSNQRRCL